MSLTQSQLVELLIIDPKFDASEKAFLESAIWDLYQKVPELTRAFDALVGFGILAPQKLTINFVPDNFAGKTEEGILPTPRREHVSELPGYLLDLDLKSEKSRWYIQKDGTIIKSSLKRLLGHELIHALVGKLDPLTARTQKEQSFQETLNYLGTLDADYVGDTVDSENVIGQLIGEPWERIGYFNPAPERYRGYSKSLTDGAEVSRLLTLGGEQNGDVDFHLLSGDTLLLTDGSGQLRIIGTQGNDFLYGGRGNDIFYGNTGSDYLHGGDSFLNTAEAGLDTADYSTWDSFSARNDAPITIHLGQASGALELGERVAGETIEVDDGHGGTDRLVFIDKIIGTDKDDTVQIKALNDAQTQRSVLTIDLGSGDNIVDLSEGRSSFTVHLENFDDQTVQETGGASTLHFLGVDKVIGSKNDDTFYLGYGDYEFFGGEGSDTYIVTGSGTVIIDTSDSAAGENHGDGKGKVIFGGFELKGGKNYEGDNGERYEIIDDPANGGLKGLRVYYQGQKLFIKNWIRDKAELGIHLIDDVNGDSLPRRPLPQPDLPGAPVPRPFDPLVKFGALA